MGERLIFEVIRHDKRLCCLHYHWSAYTGSCYFEARDLIRSIRTQGYTKETSDADLIRMILHYLYRENKLDTIIGDKPYRVCGGLLIGQDSVIKEMYPDVPESEYTPDEGFSVSRSHGLLILSEDACEKALDAAQDIEEINFDLEIFTNAMWFTYEPPLDDADIREEIGGDPETLLPVFTQPPDELPYWEVSFDDIDKIIEWFETITKDDTFRWWDPLNHVTMEIKS